MIALRVMCSACKGLYLNMVFRFIKPHRQEMIQKSKFWLQLPVVGVGYRILILEIFNIFEVFYTNGLLTNRHQENADPDSDGIIKRELLVPSRVSRSST